MKEMMRNMAAAVQPDSRQQQMVLVVRLYYGAWEDTTACPRKSSCGPTAPTPLAGKVETEER